MTDHWPEEHDDPVDPAFAPLIEAGEGESEGFELAEDDLIEHASHGDQHGTSRIGFDSIDEAEESDPDVYGEADAEEDPDA